MTTRALKILLSNTLSAIEDLDRQERIPEREIDSILGEKFQIASEYLRDLRKEIDYGLMLSRTVGYPEARKKHQKIFYNRSNNND